MFGLKEDEFSALLWSLGHRALRSRRWADVETLVVLHPWRSLGLIRFSGTDRLCRNYGIRGDRPQLQ